MFEVNGVYANRKGEYTVLAINGPMMHVRFTDGSEAELSMRIQGRIWENIVSEREAAEAKEARRATRMGHGNVQHFIKVVSLPAAQEMMFPGWQEKVIMAPNPIQASAINVGDRLIYYGNESGTFFAVATITTAGKQRDPKDYFFATDLQTAYFFSVDVDADSHRPDYGVTRESVELESYPNFRKQKFDPESLLKISEDDFELLAEILTEVSEDEFEDLEDEEEEYIEEDEE